MHRGLPYLKSMLVSLSLDACGSPYSFWTRFTWTFNFSSAGSITNAQVRDTIMKCNACGAKCNIMLEPEHSTHIDS
jgi:hypothetical protein